MADVKWISLSINMFDNRKIKSIRLLPEGNNIVLIWVMLLTIAGRCNADGNVFVTEDIPYTTKVLANELGFKEKTIKNALDTLVQFDMIQVAGGYIHIIGWSEHQNIDGMAKIREQNRIRKQRQRDKSQNECEMSRDTSRLMSRDVTQQNKNKRENIDKKESVKEKAPAPKREHGEYKNVLLTDEELAKLQAEYPADYESMIENLSSYMASKKVSYESHYATIRRWAKEDKQKANEKGAPAYVKNNPFLQFKQSDTDYAALERELIKN